MKFLLYILIGFIISVVIWFAFINITKIEAEEFDIYLNNVTGVELEEVPKLFDDKYYEIQIKTPTEADRLIVFNKIFNPNDVIKIPENRRLSLENGRFESEEMLRLLKEQCGTDYVCGRYWLMKYVNEIAPFSVSQIDKDLILKITK